MRSHYPVPAEMLSCSEEIKKSRFLSYIKRTTDKEAARAWITAIANEHPQARHCCWAHIAGHPDDSQCLGFSDDGEPSGTAGRPLLQLLQGSGLGEVTAVVVRYYGGIKLGTGGLVRAYSSGVAHLLKDLPTLELQLGLPFRLVCSYEEVALCQRLFEEAHCSHIEACYAESVTLQGECPLGSVELLDGWLINRTHGRLRPEWIKEERTWSGY